MLKGMLKGKEKKKPKGKEEQASNMKEKLEGPDPANEKFYKQIPACNKKIDAMRGEIEKTIVGQRSVVDAVIKCIICRGHILLESVPGLAKTLLVTTLSNTISNTSFKRIQFTPDLLPTDITGMTVYEESRGFYTVKGPIFANIILADEINRTPPKVQAAMLQAMQERQVTIGRETHDLPKPFFVLATQNPLEQKGVYPLAVAQVDRFLFKVILDYPTEEEEFLITENNTIVKKMKEYDVKQVISPKNILEIQELVKKIYISKELKSYITSVVDATRYPAKYGIEKGQYIRWGASPRASIFLSLAAKATAFLDNRAYVTPEDIKSIANEVLMHRIILNYEGKAREIQPTEIIEEILRRVQTL